MPVTPPNPPAPPILESTGCYTLRHSEDSPAVVVRCDHDQKTARVWVAANPAQKPSLIAAGRTLTAALTAACPQHPAAPAAVSGVSAAIEVAKTGSSEDPTAAATKLLTAAQVPGAAAEEPPAA